MKDPTPFTDFCNAVCAQVRFRPDRAAILSELWDHLEDHADALKERGIPILDAREEAVAAMGDPVELGKALDKLHSPLAGWLLVVLKWASRLAAALAALFLVLSLFRDLPALLDPSSSLAAQQEAQYQLFQENAAEVLLLHPSDTAAARTGDYTLSIPYAFLQTSEDGRVSLAYELEVTHWNPWYRLPSLELWITAEDDRGNVYFDTATYEKAGLPLGTPRSWGGPSAIHTPFVSHYGMNITGLDPDATQLTLTLQPFGTWECALTLSLEGGEPS